MLAEKTAPVDDEVVSAIGRRARYLLLSRAFSYPSEATRRELRAEVVPQLEATSTDDAALDSLAADLARKLVSLPLDVWREAHGRVFTHIEPQDYPPYESAYLPADVFRQTNLMADVAGFYRAHGLRVGGELRERPDHAAAELEFMSFMAHKEAYALTHLGEEQVAECRRTQEHFLSDHLGTWAPGFGRRVAAFGGEDVYRMAGELLEKWVEFDLELCGVEPVRRLDEPQPQPPADDACGGCDLYEPGREL